MRLHNRHWWRKGEWQFQREYNLFKRAKFCAAEIRLNAFEGCSGVMLFVAIPKLLDFWFTVIHPWIDRRLPTKRTKSYVRDEGCWDMPVEKTIGIKWHHGTLWWSLWETAGEWSSNQPWWWGGSFNPADFFLGRAKRTKTNVRHLNTMLRLPEGDYPVKAKQYEVTWKRPRSLLKKTASMVSLDFCTALPIPGKGENSWDIGDDAIYSSTVRAKTVEEALRWQRQRILDRRAQYGGSNWAPDAGWPLNGGTRRDQ